MLPRTKSTLISLLLIVPAMTFGTASGAAEAADPGEKFCFDGGGSPGGTAIVNLTPINATADGNGRLTPLERLDDQASFSNVNYGVGTVDSNLAFTEVGDLDTLCFVGTAGSKVDLVADAFGTIEEGNFYYARPNRAPKRVVDTRKGAAIRPRQRRCFAVTGDPGDLAVVNLTPVGATATGDGQLTSPNVVRPPKASNVNYAPGTVDPNVAVARIGKNGKVCYINSPAASVDLVADYLGAINGNAFQPARANGAPKRILDTRSSTKVSPGEPRCFRAAGLPGDIAIVNLTPVQATGRGAGLLLTSDYKDDPPIGASVNYGLGTVSPNLAFVRTGEDRQVCFLTSGAPVHLIADQVGTLDRSLFTSMFEGGVPSRDLDTRSQGKITPIKWSGDEPLMPGDVKFACGYEGTSTVGNSTRRVRFGMSQAARGRRLRVTYYGDPQPNQGNNFVVDTTPAQNVTRFSYVRTVTGPPSSIPYQSEWVGRVKIETVLGYPKPPRTLFKVEAKCSDGRVNAVRSGESNADDAGTGDEPSTP